MRVCSIESASKIRLYSYTKRESLTCYIKPYLVSICCPCRIPNLRFHIQLHSMLICNHSKSKCKENNKLRHRCQTRAPASQKGLQFARISTMMTDLPNNQIHRLYRMQTLQKLQSRVGNKR